MFLGREEKKLAYIEAYLKANKLFRDYNNPEQDPVFSEVRSTGGKVFLCSSLLCILKWASKGLQWSA